jgi:uncharacterized phiE125 gp8 family phage protein
MVSIINKIRGGEGLPITLVEAMQALRVDSADDGPIVERCYRTAQAFIEIRTPFVPVQSEFEAILQSWSDCGKWPPRWEIFRAPLREVREIKYLAADFTWSTVDLENFLVSIRPRSFLVDAKSTFTPPALACARDCVKVVFSAGYDGDEIESGQEDRVIDPGLVGILHGMAAHLYKNRELLDADNLAKTESGLGSLLGAYRDFY